MMEYRQLGATGIEVSLLGLGTVKLGRDTGVNYARPFRLPTMGEARRLLDRAQALGVNLVDTAPAYGTSEQRLGELLAGQRQRWVIVTKVGEEFDGKRSTHDFSPEHTVMSVHRSLERLRTDYLDVVLIHSDGNDEYILNELGTLHCLKQLQHQGLIRAAGISHKTPAGGRVALNQGADVIMATLNATNLAERRVIEDAGNQGCGVLVKKALAGGRETPQGLRLVAQTPGVSSIVVGTRDPQHLARNAEILPGKT